MIKETQLAAADTADAAQQARECVLELRALFGEHASVSSPLAARLAAVMTRHGEAVDVLLGGTEVAAGKHREAELAGAVIRGVCAEEGMALEELRAPTCSTRVSLVREWAMRLASDAGVSPGAVGEVLGRSEETVVHHMRRWPQYGEEAEGAGDQDAS